MSKPDETCAVCGTETTYHQQTVNGEPLTRCRKHSPKRGWKGVLSDAVFAVAIPVVVVAAAAHLFTDFSLGLVGSADYLMELQRYAPWLEVLQTVEYWIVTALSVGVLASVGLLLLILLAGHARSD